MKYRLEAVDTFKKNFSVDDTLKSVSSVLEVITLVKVVGGMCRASNFRLTKFVSNNKELLM